jgi:hypothetical protein
MHVTKRESQKRRRSVTRTIRNSNNKNTRIQGSNMKKKLKTMVNKIRITGSPGERGNDKTTREKQDM